MARLTLDDILNQVPPKLSQLKGAELRKAVGDATRIANQRMRRLRASGYDELSNAMDAAARHGNQVFTIRGVNDDAALRNVFKDVYGFLTAKTSTIPGVKQTKAKVYERIGGKFKDVNAEKEFWRDYRRTVEIGSSAAKVGSTELQRQIYRMYKQDTDREMRSMLREVNTARMDQIATYDYDLDELINNGLMIADDGSLIDIGLDNPTSETRVTLAAAKAATDYEKTKADRYLRRRANFRSI